MATKLTEINSLLDSYYDALFVSASFEKRCLSIYSSIKEEINFEHKFVSASVHHRELIQGNLDIFLQDGFEKFDVSNKDQVATFVNISKKIDKIVANNNKASLLFDISTFTRQTILILLRILRAYLSTQNSITFVYTPALEYSPGLPDEHKWLTKGILSVDSVLGYSGIIGPSRHYHLIILMGFEVERASMLISEYEPKNISIGYANETDSMPEHYTINKRKFDELLYEFPFAESFEFSCNHVLECTKEILAQSRKYSNCNVVISPMNNKLSTVACALSAIENKHIQLATAIPVIYNHNYSTIGETCHILKLTDLLKDK